MNTEKQAIVDALHAFINQRGGIDPRNYGSWQSYRAESRSVTRDLHDARELLRSVSQRDSITAADMKEACRAFSGRLTLKDVSAHYDDGSIYYRYGVDYCTGQYFPTEYRKAVAAVCSAALWDRKRADMPAAIVKDGEKFYPHAAGSRNLVSAGDWIRTSFKREYGARLASRYFS